MSYAHYGSDMDQPAYPAGSVKRARERAQAGLAPPPRRPHQPIVPEEPQGYLSPPPRRHMPPPQPQSPGQQRPQRPRAGPSYDTRGQPIISRPTQVPHWPLPPGSPLSLGTQNQYRPPPGQPSQAPPRPARPSQVPSFVDQSRPQQPTPVFFTPAVDSGDEEDLSHARTSSVSANASSRLTTSSVGTIPDFPVPTIAPPPPPPVSAVPPRKSFNLGPPPSSRRGASSFYSNASYVSPIPEEKSTRSRGSYASSAAIPGSWRTVSPDDASSPFRAEAFYDDSVTERSRDSMGDDSGDESKLVRSASIGKRTKPSLVDTKPPPQAAAAAAAAAAQLASRPYAQPVQVPFEGGTGFLDGSSASSNNESKTPSATTPEERNRELLMPVAAGAAAHAEDVNFDASPRPSMSGRRSGLKLPPKLDIDAVRDMEARGSITSLPDLIKRATRLAAMMDKGRRPASRFDLNDFPDEKGAMQGDRDDSGADRYRSGLSDMLAAFPPPGQPNNRQSRGSWFRYTSWPRVPGRNGPGDLTPIRTEIAAQGAPSDRTPRMKRRYCGMPLWGLLLLIFFLLCVVAVAIVLPLQFFVFKTLPIGNSEEQLSSIEQCRLDLDCQNGGTNVFSDGVCSCICTNGFTGSDCSNEGSDGCTTTNIVSEDEEANVDDVTLGTALPRLIQDANGNFSIPLSGTGILAKINSGDLSCREQNSLVTFDGRSTRAGAANSEVIEEGDEEGDAIAKRVVDNLIVRWASAASPTIDLAPRTTETPSEDEENSEEEHFTVTEEVLDFSRVAILYILQEQSSREAESAQTTLQRFLSDVARGDSPDHTPIEDARNVTIGGFSSVDLVDYRVDLGDGLVGNDPVRRRDVARRGGSTFLRW